MRKRKSGKILLLAACLAVFASLPAHAQGRFGGRWAQQGGANQGASQDQSAPQEDVSTPEGKQALRQQLMKLPPDQRRQRMQELRQKFQQQRQQRLAERQQKFSDKWSKASPEQRSKFCSNIVQRCSGEDADKPRCQLAQTACAGNK